jgi:hypothetical protein
LLLEYGQKDRRNQHRYAPRLTLYV